MTGLITMDKLVPLVNPLSKMFALPIVVVTRLSDYMGIPASGRAELGLEPGWHHFSDMTENVRASSPPLVDIEPGDRALIQFTGGTTGVPKGATLTHENYVVAAQSSALWGLELTESVPIADRYVMCVMPYSHVYGEVSCLGCCTFSASTQVILPRFEIDEVFDTLKKFQSFTYFPCVPTIMGALLKHPRSAEIDWFHKINFFGSGAAPCPTDLIHRARELDVSFNEGWGMSETCGVGTCNPMGRTKPLSIGLPYIGFDLRIVNPDTLEDVPRGERGELIVTSPTVMREYWNNPEETARSFTADGWFRTGDIAFMDEDYYVFMVDRMKDMIIAGGYNVYPRDIDEVLFTHPKVRDAISIGIPDYYRGETVKAFVQLESGAQATEVELIEHCRKVLAPYKVPTAIEFRDALPRSPVGKALRRTLRAEEETARTKRN